MNFLDLAKRVRQECGISGTGPSTVVSQTGEMKRVVDWTAQAWVEIQNRYPNWRWMRSRWTLNTVAATDAYAYTAVTDELTSLAISRFKRWWPLDENDYSNVKIYLQSAGVGTERWLPYLPWSNFRALYKIGSQTDQAPAHFTIDPQNKLVFGPRPNAVYVVSGEYQRGAQRLAANDDTPDMPEDYHFAIVGRAMEKVGRFDAALEVFNGGLAEGARVMRQLEQDQLPAMPLAEPMA